MGKCNLLKPLSSNNGNFFMFSQYSEDLTIEYTQKDTARVVPSKFIALNLNTYGLNNTTIAEIFQNYYENHCCYWRGQGDYNKSFSWELLLQTLESFNMISTQEISTQDGKYKTSSNIKYIGNINIYSNQEVDGMSYNEIYCYIPNDAKEQQWKITDNTVPSKQSDEKIPDYIQGFDADDLQDSSTDKYYNGLTLNPYKSTKSNSIEPINNFRLHYNHLLDFSESGKLGDVDSEQFEINTIIVLYDIKNGDKSVYSNLPMGIYFTGKIDNGVINNPITKYVSNAESYDQGTSYGLRICTRYLSQVNIKTLQENIKVDTTSDGIYPENVTVLLSKLNESQLLMSDALNKTVENAENLKNHYNLFKTSKTNVPYIQNINGEPYWFVNGKNTETKVLDEDKLNVKVNQITESEYNDISNRYLTSTSPIDIPDKPQNYINKYLEKYEMTKFAKDINLNYAKNNYVDDQVKKMTDKFEGDFLKKTDASTTYLTKNVADKSYLSISSVQSLVSFTNMNQLCTTSKIIDAGEKLSVSISDYRDIDIILMQDSMVELYINGKRVMSEIIYLSYDAEQYITISDDGSILNHCSEPILINVKFDYNNLLVFISFKNIFRKL